MKRALREGLAEALGPNRPRARQLDLFECTAVLDIDDQAVDLGELVELWPTGGEGVLVAIEGRYGDGSWRVVVERADGVQSVRGSHQIRRVTDVCTCPYAPLDDGPVPRCRLCGGVRAKRA